MIPSRLLCIIAAALPLAAAAYGDPDDTMTGLFTPEVRTLTVTVEGDRLAPPVITLDSPDRLQIGFDYLGDERQYLRYSIYHCTPDWQLSDMVDAEVFDNFNYADLTDYAFSRGTTVHYVHYTITLPNDEYRFLLSGNYLLRVYPELEPDDTLLQVRFMVSEATIGVGGAATSHTDEGYNTRYQQLEIDLDLARQQIRDPYNDLVVKVIPNGRYDQTRTVTHPSRLQGNRAIYDHNRDLIFTGGNEYRRMETTMVTYPTMGVDHIDYEAPYYHHVLNTAHPRMGKTYQYDQTQHGRFFVREYNSEQSDTEADYTVVHFTLDMLPPPGYDVYLDGDLTNRRFDSGSRMEYLPDEGIYHRALLLKQGAYNYQYVTLPREAQIGVDGLPDRPSATAETEGDFYQTVNEYLVLVYYRAPSDRYHRLLGASTLTSGR